MKTQSKHIKTLLLMAAALLTLLTACERRDLWIAERDLNQVRLVVDWSLFNEKPTGMTAIFYPHDGGSPVVVTTANIYSTTVDLPQGRYDVILFNQLATEYSNQYFENMDMFDQCRVKLDALEPQPAPNARLFNASQGVFRTPDPMATDTLLNVVISSASVSDSLIRYQDRDDYISGRPTTQVIKLRPLDIVYTLNIRVFVNGIQNMYGVKGSIEGLAAGYELGACERSRNTVQCALDNWKATAVTDSTGYITTSIRTFGRVNREVLRDEDMKLHLDFLLVDMDPTHARDFHFNVANIITSAIEEADIRALNSNRTLDLELDANGNITRELVLDLLIDVDTTHPYLPDTEHADRSESGFDAIVDDWKHVDIDVPI